MHPIRQTILGATLAFLAVSSPMEEMKLNAQEIGFRVETDLFVEGVAEPFQQSLTLFFNGVGYDVSRDNEAEITMVDPGRDRIVLINTQHKIQTELPISQLHRLTASAKEQAAQDPNLSIFVQEADKVVQDSDAISVGGKMLRYETTTQRPSDLAMAKSVAETYRHFADAVKQLNSLRKGGDPPFARMKLNETVQKEDSIPKEMSVTMQRGKRQAKLTCRLHATWLLSRDDRSRIEDIGIMKANFEVVSDADYQRITVEKVAKAAAVPAG